MDSENCVRIIESLGKNNKKTWVESLENSIDSAKRTLYILGLIK